MGFPIPAAQRGVNQQNGMPLQEAFEVIRNNRAVLAAVAPGFNNLERVAEAVQNAGRELQAAEVALRGIELFDNLIAAQGALRNNENPIEDSQRPIRLLVETISGIALLAGFFIGVAYMNNGTLNR